MENNSGKVTREADGFRVRFERTLNHDIAKVWDAITNPEKLKLWFTDFEMELKPGAKIIIRFRDDARTVTYGEVVTVQKPRKFAFTWEGELGVWELFDEGENKTRVVFTYSKMADQYAVGATAGFHTLMDRLSEMLNGSTTTYPFGTEEHDPAQTKMRAEYGRGILKDFPELEKFEPLVIERTYNAPIEKVWKAITDKDQMKQWYFDLADFKPEVGFEFQFYGQGSKGEQYLHLCKVTEVVMGRKLTYSWSYKGMEGISHVTFELTPAGSRTNVKLTHRGLHSFASDSSDFARKSFNAGWTELLGTHLKNFLDK